MSKNGPIGTLSLACPNGGNFYICQGNSTEFLGCCTSDPCAGGEGSCPQANLRTATFNKLDYQGIPAQSCTDASKAAWYLCSALSTPFMGCCASNACANATGCPQSDLVPAMLGNATQARVFLTTTTTTTTTTTAGAARTSQTGTGTTSASSTAAATSAVATATGEMEKAVPASVETELSTGAKAGIGVGAVALVALVGVLFFVVRRVVAKRRGVVVRGSEPPSPNSMMSDTPTSGYSDPNQIPYSTHPFSGAQQPSRPSPATKSPSMTYAQPYSASSSPSAGFLSRETSVRSAASNNALGIMPGSSPAETPTRPAYHQYVSQLGYASPPLDTLAELDGGEAFPSPAISEMPGPTPTTSRPSMPFRPYRPSR